MYQPSTVCLSPTFVEKRESKFTKLSSKLVHTVNFSLFVQDQRELNFRESGYIVEICSFAIFKIRTLRIRIAEIA